MKKITKILIAIIFLSTPFISKAMPSDVYTFFPVNSTELTDTSAILRGKAIPSSGINTKGYFRYSTQSSQPVFCNDIYSSDMVGTSDFPLNPNLTTSTPMASVNFYKEITGLTPNTTYFYCAYASDRSGIAPSPISTPSPVKSFKTKGPTKAVTKNAINITSISATLKGEYNTETTATTSFEYRIGSNNFSSSTGTIPVQSNEQTETSQPFLASLTNLTPDTFYYFRAVAQSPNGQKVYGLPLSFKTKSDETTSPCPPGTSLTIPPTMTVPCPTDTGNPNVNPNGGNGYTPRWPINPTTLPPGTLINVTTPTGPGVISIDDVVRNTEGVEHVFQRQVENRPSLAKIYGYQNSMDIKLFSWNLAHTFAQLFGYVNNLGKEIRVSYPNVAAYEIQPQTDGSTIVNEYLIGTLIDSKRIQPILLTPHGYEYYYQHI